MSVKGVTISPQFLGWADHFSNLPITRAQVLDFVTEVKGNGGENRGDSERMGHMSNYIFTALVQTTLKCEPRPKFQDELFTIDEELVDHCFGGGSSIFGKISKIWSSKILQVFLVHAKSAAILLANKKVYGDSIEGEVDKKLFEYFVNLVDPAHFPAAGDDDGEGEEWPNFPFGDDDCPAGLQTYKFMDIVDEGISQSCPSNSSRPTLLKKNRVLTIDGGGIRGLVPLQALKELQANLEPGKSIQSCFDLIVGTSTGGLIALTLATGHTVQEIEAFYLKMKDQVFSTSKPYDGANYEGILKDFFGPQKTMGEIEGVKVIVTATFGTVEELRLKLFTNFDQDSSQEEIWKVARRTSAAPSYFDPMIEEENPSNKSNFVQCAAHGRHVPVYYDGGLMANNPTRAVLIRYTDLVRDGIVVSLGTGKPAAENTPLPALSNVLSMWWFGDLRKFADAFINRITRTDGDVVEDDLRLCKEFNCAYFRLTPTLAEVIELDETDEGKIVNLMWLSKAFVHRQRAAVNLIAQFITPQTTNQNGGGKGWGCSIQ